MYIDATTAEIAIPQLHQYMANVLGVPITLLQPRLLELTNPKPRTYYIGVIHSMLFVFETSKPFTSRSVKHTKWRHLIIKEEITIDL